MLGNFQAATVAALIVLGVACGRPAAGGETPFVSETGVPKRPPRAALVMQSRARSVAQLGFLYTADWSTRLLVATRDPRVPVPWPTPLSIDRRDSPTIELGTTVVPDYVTVNAYARIAAATGTPRGTPIATFDCARLSQPKCEVVTSNERLVIRGLGPRLLTGQYLTVFCIWHVPTAEQRPVADPPDDVSASWLFDFRNTSELGASQP
jgi:hypothetical protein